MNTDGMPAEQLDAIEERANAATQGPWRWRGNTEAHNLRLQTPYHGGLTVMDFTRWGMQSARPRFAVDHIMHMADEMVVYEVAAWSKDIYRKDVVGIDHPDAEFIAAARQDVPVLVAEVRRLTAALAAEQTAHEDTQATLASYQLLVPRLQQQLEQARAEAQAVAGRCGDESRGRRCDQSAGHPGDHQALGACSVSYVWASS